MRALDLFTGYGGITLALKDYVRPIAYVEIEDYAQKIIANRMADGSLPRARILADVKNIRGQIGCCDIIYGGFPCQDISVAGNGKGLEGKRSGLFFEVIRLTKEIRPSFVFLENVPAIRTRGLEQVVKAFTEIGYDCRWTCLSAASIGANHKRERWFLLAHTNSNKHFNEKSESNRIQEKLESFFWSENCATRKLSGASINQRKISSSLHVTYFKRFKSKLNYAVDDSWWEVEPSVGRVADGSSFRMERLKALGNGVVPLQVRTAFEKLIGIEVLNEI